MMLVRRTVESGERPQRQRVLFNDCGSLVEVDMTFGS